MPLMLDTVVAAEEGILLIILSLMTLKDLHNAASVCRIWSQSIEDIYVQHWTSTSHWNSLLSRKPYVLIGMSTLMQIENRLKLIVDHDLVISDTQGAKFVGIIQNAFLTATDDTASICALLLVGLIQFILYIDDMPLTTTAAITAMDCKMPVVTKMIWLPVMKKVFQDRLKLLVSFM